MFIGLYCCLLVRVQSLSLTWAGLHNTKSLWALFQWPIVDFWLGYPIFYLGTSKFSPQQHVKLILQCISYLTYHDINSFINKFIVLPFSNKNDHIYFLSSPHNTYYNKTRPHKVCFLS